MYEISIAVLLISTCVGLVRGYNISPSSNLLINANRFAAERLDWRTPLSTKKDQFIVLSFDDIPTSDGQAAIELYNGLLFEGLTVIDVSNSGVIDDEDRNCVTSHPNTLVSSLSPDGQLPRIKIGAAQSNDGNSSLVFDIVSLSIKPRLKRSSDPVLIKFKLWQVRNRKTEATNFYQVFHGVGHHTVTYTDFGMYEFTIKDLTAVEIAVMEDSKLEFAFCLDDLGVRIHNMTESKISE